ncbi:LOW QUALITY PROTEIN: hypothetical protein CFOL_v3_14949, partial [Cephalotus follicularis]
LRNLLPDQNNLCGRIPDSLAFLSNLTLVTLRENSLTGPLPIELSKLENVQEHLSHNSLQGQLPDTLGELKNLESFDVSENHLSGIIP